MRKEIWPVGYTIRYGGIITGIMIYIGLFVFFLVSGVSNSQKDIMEFKKFAIGVIGMITVLVCLEIHMQYNTYKMREARKYIIKSAIHQTRGYAQRIEFNGRLSTAVHFCIFIAEVPELFRWKITGRNFKYGSLNIKTIQTTINYCIILICYKTRVLLQKARRNEKCFGS